MSKNTSISVIIPSYRHVGDCARIIGDVCSILAGSDYQIIVVIDGLQAKDKNLRHIQRLHSQVDGELVVLQHFKRLGKGGALREGVKRATKQLVAFIDADGVISVSYLPFMVSILHKDASCKAVIARRVRYHAFALRGVLSRIFRVIQSILFSALPWDTQAGLKVFTRKTAHRIFDNLKCTGYAFDVDLLLQMFLSDEKILSVPVIQHRGGHSNVTFATMSAMLFDILSLYFSFIPKEIQYARVHPIRWFVMLRHLFIIPWATSIYLLLKLLRVQSSFRATVHSSALR